VDGNGDEIEIKMGWGGNECDDNGFIIFTSFNFDIAKLHTTQTQIGK